MITAFELAGFVAAHAVWCLSDEDGLPPMAAFRAEDGQRTFERLVFDDAGVAIEHGRKHLESAPFGASDGVLAYDGLITTPAGKKLDAIILEIRAYAFPLAKAAIAVAYTPQGAGDFRVHKPKLVTWNHCDDFDVDAAIESFFNGIASHERGAKVWNDALDESK
ncbi:hypothetical protein [Burkholderia stagnalis]|uniref:hypothetical protein n=1 Tax=Burkholderia stagnalis TaxID=1503054 RepID=UPI000756F1D8|nr:hypothetical protein [Burkholderia stagnalis]KVO53080.1 hypothetical protein WT18_27210 [Burkholderia stagnalis]KVP15772.1 hypothetical protein WT20_04790 [Burkholderia stagnalis]KVW91106.1 hypothetical protein WT30_24920 [Burkholderia stagnalis]KWH82790.1 hypothetical protein WT66_09020 [Burkholderia stagnalis]KWK27049.1 hypothetical protein WT77_09600 [Burkholderia stagnalis]